MVAGSDQLLAGTRLDNASTSTVSKMSKLTLFLFFKPVAQDSPRISLLLCMHSAPLRAVVALLISHAAAFVPAVPATTPGLRPGASILSQTRSVSAQALGLRIRARAANTGACLKMSGGESDSVVVFVTVTVPSDKDEEFNKVMAADVAGSRAEPGCLRFDLVKGEKTDKGTVYHFYEAYKDAEAAAFHKEQPHYKLWADFKAANMDTVGASQSVVKGCGVIL